MPPAGRPPVTWVKPGAITPRGQGGRILNWIKAANGSPGDDRVPGPEVAVPFTLLILVFLLGLAVWALYQTNPRGVDARRLALVNALVMVLAVVATVAVALWLYPDAEMAKAREKGMATYLTIMAAGCAFMIVVAAGGVARNFFVFPLGARAEPVRASD